MQPHPMSDLLYARALMGISLAFHIVFAAVGVTMPLLMALAEWRLNESTGCSAGGLPPSKDASRGSAPGYPKAPKVNTMRKSPILPEAARSKASESFNESFGRGA